mgnify:CR=1 FL=1
MASPFISQSPFSERTGIIMYMLSVSPGIYLLNPNFIALFALHVLCNIKTAMKSISTNPFLITGYQGPDYFCDREKETASLMSALKNGKNITLISPRRMGKTGL